MTSCATLCTCLFLGPLLVSAAQNCPISNLAVVRGSTGGVAEQCGQPCAAPSLTFRPGDDCRYNASNCATGVSAGNVCEVTCKDPYVGASVLVTCPLDNSVADRAPFWSPPDCDLPGLSCPQPATPPEGYERGPGDTWQCASTHIGRPVKRCVPAPDCTASLQLSGCEPKQECIVPEVDQCMLDVSDCAGGVSPGDSCVIHCRAPYTGSPATATCVVNSTSLSRDLQFTVPACELQCTDPPPQQPTPGYVQQETGDWHCADGYGGNASWRCAIDHLCVSRKEFGGCAPLQPCAVPVLDDPCKYDFSQCTNVLPGASCTLLCRQPYVGNTTTARCPASNVNASQPLLWDEPNCQVQCPEMAPVPIGYVSYPYRMAATGWECVDGFAGRINVSCTTNELCQPEMKMDGCLSLQACVAPSLTAEEFCKYDMLTCFRVDSGNACDVHCRAPYHVGASVQAVCPGNNTDPTRELVWAWPSCTIQCQDPPQWPAGYEKLDTGEWVCASGYEGTPTVSCVMQSDCTVEMILEGCQKTYPCVLPPIAEDPDFCFVDWSNCVGLFSEADCEIRCRDPYFGNSTNASCPSPNTEPNRELNWTLPDCTMTCGEAQPKPGYEINDWECEEGYAGEPSVRCVASEEACAPAMRFTGCRPLHACAPPEIPAGSECMFNATDCAAVEPGGSCEMRCVEPYAGMPTPAFCPEANTNPGQEVFWIPPGCRLMCPDPPIPPEGFALDPDCGWVCAPGWAGVAQKRCSVGPDCQAQVELSGCDRVLPCAPPPVNDTCKIDVSACEALNAGESCSVRCQAPYTAGSGHLVRLSCPDQNTDPTQLPLWPPGKGEEDVNCLLECAESANPPMGYVHNATGGEYSCAPGYLGEAQWTCVVDQENCTAQLEWAGCLPIVACETPVTVNPCKLDYIDCPPQLAAGTTCPVRCKSPYLVSPGYPAGTLTCPSDNVDPNHFLIEEPVCDLGCLEPTSQEGYVYNAISGTWSCASGWIGVSVRTECTMDSSCIVRPTLYGCSELKPCQPLVLSGSDACKYDVSECQNIMAGERCSIRCLDPLVGYFTRASCDFTNTDASAQLRYSMPVCTCRDPDPMPAGYQSDLYQIKSCAAGYVGTPVETCIMDDACNSRMELKGCTEMMSCRDIGTISSEATCKYETANCSVIGQGETCAVGCAAPYHGNATQALCPAGNTNPFRTPSNLPDCRLTCSGPTVQVGYRPGFGWRCSFGYRGTPTTVCTNTSGCGSELQLQGCIPWVPCKLPTLYDQLLRCSMDFSNCYSLPAGSYCQVRCLPPFRGEPTRAFCPPGNTDPEREMIWVPPACEREWPDPSPHPVGYVKSRECGWRCAPLYHGPAVVEVTMDYTCTPTLHLSGCFRTESCRANIESVDLCRIDAAECFVGDMPAGTSCQVRCKPPFVGSPATVRCPDNNTVYGHDLDWVEPACNFSCQDPNPMPDGYLRPTPTTWACAPGYIGTPVARCTSDSYCLNPTYNLSGCNRSHPCQPITHPDPCRFDVDACSSVQPGSSCVVGCKAPYVGGTSVATCPEGNTDPMGQLVWQEHACSLDCTGVIQSGPGYLQFGDTWQCSPEATGSPIPFCSIDDACNPVITLRGCTLRRPCVSPPVDACRVHADNCTSLAPGETCWAECRQPYVGQRVNATCPVNNTNSSYILSWAEPLSCDCPDPPPTTGYAQTFTNGTGSYVCAPGYTGQAELVCNVDSNCTPTTTLHGCKKILACEQGDDQTGFRNHSQCRSVLAGTSCMADCMNTPCLGGGPLEYRCPAMNTHAGLQPLHVGGLCEVKCEVCDVGQFNDEDSSAGHVGGVLSFGPAQAGGSTLLPDILGYRVHWADDCGEHISLVAELPRVPFTPACCSKTAYSVTLEAAAIPEGATQFVITVVTTYGELPYGRHVPLYDHVGRAPIVVGAVSSAAPQAKVVALLTQISFFLAWLALDQQALS